MDESVEVTVLVPKKKLSQLYRSCAELWDEHPQREEVGKRPWDPDVRVDVEQAAKFYVGSNEQTQRLIDLLISESSHSLSLNAAAKQLDITESAVNGLLSPVSRRVNKLNRSPLIENTEGVLRMSNDTAEVFVKAIAKGEGGAKEVAV